MNYSETPQAPARMRIPFSRTQLRKVLFAAKAKPLLRCIAWLGFLCYLLLSPPLSADEIGTSAIFVALMAFLSLQQDSQHGVGQMMSLHNAIWLGLIIYALPIYILYAITDISSLLDMTPNSLGDAASLSLISISLTSIGVEIIRPWTLSFHKKQIQRIATYSRGTQFYIAAILVLIYGINYYSSGVLDMILSGNRFEITKTFESGKMWFIQYLMTGATIAFIYRYFYQPRARSGSFYFGFATITTFWTMYISMGNRRGALTVVIAAAVCFIARSKNGSRAIIFLALAFVGAGLVGILRQDASEVAPDQALLIGVSNSLGEFIYPGYTLVHTIELAKAPTFEFTWVSMLYNFLAAQLQGDSFAFLAHRFALDAAPSGAEVMGFAYLPITEGFVNFGSFGAAFSGIGMLTSILLLAWIYRKHAWIYLILISLALDINRSEFVAMLFQFSMIVGGFLMTTKIRLNR